MPQILLYDQIYDYLAKQNYFPKRGNDEIRFTVDGVDFGLMIHEGNAEYFRIYTSFHFKNYDKKILKALAYKLTKKTRLVKVTVYEDEVNAEIGFYCDSLAYFVKYVHLFLDMIMNSIGYIINYFKDAEPTKDKNVMNGIGDNAILN